MENNNWLEQGLDPLVIPMVEFFNANGLKTYMSCQGHNKTNMSMFWIQFDPSVTEDDILNFMKQHLQANGAFCSNGRFAKRIHGSYGMLSGKWNKVESWNYFAATVEAANEDLQTWMNDAGVWKGVDGEEFQERKRYWMERRKEAC